MADLVFTISSGAASRSKTIADAKLAEFRTGFLKRRPVPDGVTELDHLLNFIVFAVKNEYNIGKMEIAKEALDAGIDDNLIS